MKKFLNKIRVSFSEENGWKHLTALIFIGYCLLYWGDSSYAFNTPRWPSSMVNDWVILISWQRLILSFVIGFFINLIYEFVLLVLKKIEISLLDCLWAGFGLFLGDLFYQLLPQNIFILILSISVILFTFVYIILITNRKWKKS